MSLLRRRSAAEVPMQNPRTNQATICKGTAEAIQAGAAGLEREGWKRLDR